MISMMKLQLKKVSAYQCMLNKGISINPWMWWKTEIVYLGWKDCQSIARRRDADDGSRQD